MRADLSTLSRDNAEAVARHLVMAGRLLDEDPDAAYAHASAAQQRAGRIGVVREAAGLTAYASGRHAEALRELRTARRLTGSSAHLPVMADCERGLGRPERALELAASPEASQLDADGRAELALVVAGARTDLGQAEEALLVLGSAAGAATPGRPVTGGWARLVSAYAEALGAAGRDGEAAVWTDRLARATGRPSAAGRVTDVVPAEDVVVYDLLEDDPDQG